jgi:hypothetical protein
VSRLCWENLVSVLTIAPLKWSQKADTKTSTGTTHYHWLVISSLGIIKLYKLFRIKSQNPIGSYFKIIVQAKVRYIELFPYLLSYCSRPIWSVRDFVVDVLVDNACHAYVRHFWPNAGVYCLKEEL